MTIKHMLFILQGDRRWRVVVADAHDHRDGRAIGFRYWISPADIHRTEDAAVVAALARIEREELDLPLSINRNRNTALALRKVIETHHVDDEGWYGITGRTESITDRALG